MVSEIKRTFLKKHPSSSSWISPTNKLRSSSGLLSNEVQRKYLLVFRVLLNYSHCRGMVELPMKSMTLFISRLSQPHPLTLLCPTKPPAVSPLPPGSLHTNPTFHRFPRVTFQNIYNSPAS